MSAPPPLVQPIRSWEVGAYRCDLRQSGGYATVSILGPGMAQPYHAIVGGHDRPEDVAARVIAALASGRVPSEGVYRRESIPLVKGAAVPLPDAEGPRLVLAAEGGRLLLKAVRRPPLAHLGTGAALGPPPVPNRADHPFVGTLIVHGLPIYVENEKGSVRSGVDGDGKPWRVWMGAHYGEIADTISSDGDAVDVYVGDDPGSEVVFVVHQKRPGTDEYDEPKCLLGFRSAAQAKAFYLSQYNRPGFFGGMDCMSIGAFKAAIRAGRFRKLGGEASDRARHRRTLGLPVRSQEGP